MTELEGYIRHWESVLTESGYILSPATLALIKGTVGSLKELQNREHFILKRSKT